MKKSDSKNLCLSAWLFHLETKSKSRTWKKRWCLYSNNVLHIYKEKSMKKLISRFDLSGCEASNIYKDLKSNDSQLNSKEERSWCWNFEVVSPNAQVFEHFCAISKQERDFWVFTINLMNSEHTNTRFGRNKMEENGIEKSKSDFQARQNYMHSNFAKNDFILHPNTDFNNNNNNSTINKNDTSSPKRTGERNAINVSHINDDNNNKNGSHNYINISENAGDPMDSNEQRRLFEESARAEKDHLTFLMIKHERALSQLKTLVNLKNGKTHSIKSPTGWDNNVNPNNNNNNNIPSNTLWLANRTSPLCNSSSLSNSDHNTSSLSSVDDHSRGSQKTEWPIAYRDGVVLKAGFEGESLLSSDKRERNGKTFSNYAEIKNIVNTPNFKYSNRNLLQDKNNESGYKAARKSITSLCQFPNKQEILNQCKSLLNSSTKSSFEMQALALIDTLEAFTNDKAGEASEKPCSNAEQQLQTFYRLMKDKVIELFNLAFNLHNVRNDINDFICEHSIYTRVSSGESASLQGKAAHHPLVDQVKLGCVTSTAAIPVKVSAREEALNIQSVLHSLKDEHQSLIDSKEDGFLKNGCSVIKRRQGRIHSASLQHYLSQNLLPEENNSDKLEEDHVMTSEFNRGESGLLRKKKMKNFNYWANLESGQNVEQNCSDPYSLNFIRSKSVPACTRKQKIPLMEVNHSEISDKNVHLNNNTPSYAKPKNIHNLSLSKIEKENSEPFLDIMENGKKFDLTTIDHELSIPEKVFIPERYAIDCNQELISDEEKLKRERLKEHYKDILSKQGLKDYMESICGDFSHSMIHKIDEEKEKRKKILSLNEIIAREVVEKSKSMNFYSKH